MAFSSIMTFICVGYVLAYGGMVFYDLFLAKEPVELAPKVEEEEIDISDEAKTFNPVIIDKDGCFHWGQDDNLDDEQEMTKAGEEYEELPTEKSKGEAGQVVRDSETETYMGTVVEPLTLTVEPTDNLSEILTTLLTPSEAETQESSTSSENLQDSTSISLSPESQQTATQDEEQLIETGAIELSELTGMLDVLAEKGADSPLGRIIHIWNVDAA